MRDADLNRRRNEITALLHAAEDMIEASVAGEWLREIDNSLRLRVLRTVMVVAYARAFHKGDFPLDRDTCKPADSALGELHEDLIRRWRDKVYAHTDKVGGRTAAITPRTETLGRIIGFGRNDFPMARLDEALTLFAVQRKRFEHEAESLQLTLDGELASGS